MPMNRLAELIARHEGHLLSEWMRLQTQALSSRDTRIPETQLKANSHDFLMALQSATARSASNDITRPEWSKLRDILGDLSRQRTLQGFTPTETASFVFSFKQPLFERIRQEFKNDPDALAEETWQANELLDSLGLFTAEIHQKSRDEIITRQQQEMLELSTPVVELWVGILALPLIGTLDSARTQIVMENLLEAIVSKGADLAIIDITGVPTVDTLVAQHLLKTVAAARLMGADCVISGVRPQIAQTIIHLGVDLEGVVTKATLASAFKYALQKKTLTVVPA